MSPVSLPFNDWPDQDRAAWNVLLAPGSLLRAGGAFAALRPATRRGLTYSYGRWLAFCRCANVDLDFTNPIERVTDALIDRWAEDLARLSWKSRSNHLSDLHIVLRAMAPGDERPHLRRLAREAEWHALREIRQRKAGRVPATSTLFDAGLRHMRSVTGTDLPGAIRFRDGLMIAALALLTLRHGNFRDLEIGRSFLIQPSGYDILLMGDVTKNHRILEKPVPVQLMPFFNDYLMRHRPVLIAQGPRAHSSLWVTARGGPFSHGNLGSRISTVTRRLTGLGVSPHLFRDAAATTIAREVPAQARAIAPVLGHASLGTADRYYNQARCLDASRHYNRILDALVEQPGNGFSSAHRHRSDRT